MFKSLKEKLKGWVNRTKEEVEEPKEEKKTEKKKDKKVKVGKTKKDKKEISEKNSEEELTKEPKKKTSFFSKKLTKEKFEEKFEELELILLQNNIAYEVVEHLKKSLEEKLIGSSEKNIEEALKEAIKEILINPPNIIKQIKESEKPYVVCFAGINGSGKTTTIAKFANLLQKNKLSVCLAAADTFRAASIEQIQQHADNLKIPLIKKDYGSDPASVGFEAIQYAKKNNIDVVLIDTAGRMQNKDSLMREIEKIIRVNNPDLKIFVGESITGNDATDQAKSFNKSIKIDGIILSKADVDEKGGTAISVSQVTGKPILYLGIGQTYDDLEFFDKEKIIKKLF